MLLANVIERTGKVQLVQELDKKLLLESVSHSVKLVFRMKSVVALLY